MADLGKMKVEEDITESHHELLGDWARTQLSPTSLGKKDSWRNLPSCQCLGTLHPCLGPSSGIFKVEFIT